MQFIRQFLFPILHGIIRPLAMTVNTRSRLNQLLLPLGIQAYFWIHKFFSRAFRNAKTNTEAGEWQVLFLGKIIKMPLRATAFWLDWETALSILGHEPFIKRFYADLLSSSTPPTVFLDVGANFGTHSLLFRSQGVTTLSFEPNPMCLVYFRAACALNGFTAQWQSVALGEQPGTVELLFPETEPWSGATDRDSQSKLGGMGTLIREMVEMQTLDAYADHCAGQRVLIKIDTEGAELGVLRGASLILSRHHPLLVFECFMGANRALLFDYLSEKRYTITSAAWRPGRETPPLSRADFIASDDLDFVGVPPAW